MNYFEKFWNFLREDSWQAFLVTLILAFVLIKFVFFPGLSLLTGTSLPLVIVESCSMYHQEDGFKEVLEGSVYGDYGLGLDDTVGWDFQNGFSKGDVMFVVGARDIEIGDVIIFNGGSQYPLIHRVVKTGDTYTTKGDNNPTVYLFDQNIDKDALIGKALFRIPAVGWVKLIFFESGRPEGNKGFC